MDDLSEIRVAKRRWRRWWLAILLVAVVAGVLWLGPQIVAQIQYGGMPIAAQTGGFAPDCIWSGKVVAWIDNNANGAREKGEPPLAEVKVEVDDVLNQYSRVGRSEPSDWRGETGVSVWLPGCPNAKFEVYPEVPAGYRLTSAPRLAADIREVDRTFEFGFAYLPGVPTVTPLPPPPQCHSYQIGLSNQYDLTDLVVMPDGTVWVATFNNGVAHYLPTRDRWIAYKTGDGLVSAKVRAITPGADGVVWFATAGGVARFDGSTWNSYTVADGLIHNNVYQVVVVEDNTIWFATEGGVSHFRPDQHTWKNYTPSDGLADDFVHAAAVTPDGSLWFATLTQGISRLVAPETAPHWITYGRHAQGERKVPLDMIDAIKVAPNGYYWFGGVGGLMYFDPSTKTWASTEGELGDSVNDFDFAQDGSIWIAAESTQPLLYHYLPTSDKVVRGIWHSYDKRDGLPTVAGGVNSDSVVAVSVAPDGAVWIGTREFAVRCIFPEQ